MLKITKKCLLDYRKNVYSQSGEDGILKKIFSDIGTTNKIAIEFGAWDGFYLSNTAALWTKDWKGILIEADKYKFEDLKKGTEKYDCVCINAFVQSHGKDSLDHIAQRNGIPSDVDLVSIDIDGDDYHILKSLKWLKPNVIICEFNPTIAPQIELVQEPGGYLGSSITSIHNLALEKGYQLVAMTNSNAILVVNKKAQKLKPLITSIEEMFPKKYLTYLISDFSGGYFASQKPVFGLEQPSQYGFKGTVVSFPDNIFMKLQMHLKHGVRYVKNVWISIMKKFNADRNLISSKVNISDNNT